MAPAAGRCLWTNQLCVASLFGESVHRIKQHTLGNNTIPYHIIETLVTFETRQQRVYRAPFISEDGNFDFSTALFHVTMSHGKSVQAPIRL